MSFLSKTALFLLLSLTDLSLTFLLLAVGSGSIDEGNPAARWFLAAYGWKGLAGFKALTVLIVLGVCGILHTRRPRVADRILVGSVCVVGAVVLYSCLITSYLGLLSHEYMAPLVAETWVDETGNAVEEEGDQEAARLVQETRENLVQDFLAGRCSLARAVQSLEEAMSYSDGRIIEELEKRYPDHNEVERLALLVANDVTTELQKKPANASRSARRLAAELRAYTDGTGSPAGLDELAWGKSRNFPKMRFRPGRYTPAFPPSPIVGD